MPSEYPKLAACQSLDLSGSYCLHPTFFKLENPDISQGTLEYARPFLKWAGSKRRLVHMLERLCPLRLDRYYEPFLGSGALFFHLAQSRPNFEAVLSDSNPELINVYLQVRDRTRELVEVLLEHQQNYYSGRESYYYSVRDSTLAENDVERAARMIFLNRTCYNGLFRVNRAGKFNVPHGSYDHPTICNREGLFSAADLLGRAGITIVHATYSQATAGCSRGDVVYLDPPYLPLTKTANFVDYTRESFGWSDHVRLAQEFLRLHSAGCTVVLSNSDTRKIRDLYGDFVIKTARVERMINCNAARRTGQRELVILSARAHTRKKSKSHTSHLLTSPHNSSAATLQAIHF